MLGQVWDGAGTELDWSWDRSGLELGQVGLELGRSWDLAGQELGQC